MLKRLVIVAALFCVGISSSYAFAQAGRVNVRRAAPAQQMQPITQGGGQQVAPSSYAQAPAVISAPTPIVQAPVVPARGFSEYVLGVSDRIRLNVFGEADLSGEYEVSSTGIVAMPLIGDVAASGQSLRMFEQAVRSKLSNGYLKDPRVSAQVINYRPFFILGEVTKPGSYPYVNGMTVVNAVALAGGYSYRADKGDIHVKHARDGSQKETRVSEEATVMPGDIIRVPQRFF